MRVVDANTLQTVEMLLDLASSGACSVENASFATDYQPTATSFTEKWNLALLKFVYSISPW
jgi:hypothetical protein